jgi:hypothetical protein
MELLGVYCNNNCKKTKVNCFDSFFSKRQKFKPTSTFLISRHNGKIFFLAVTNAILPS